MSRFEIVRTDIGWHSRFVAANHKTVWVTETYKRHKSAVKAILSIALEFDYAASPYIDRLGRVHTSHGGHGQTIEVREIDERGKP